MGGGICTLMACNNKSDLWTSGLDKSMKLRMTVVVLGRERQIMCDRRRSHLNRLAAVGNILAMEGNIWATLERRREPMEDLFVFPQIYISIRLS